MKKKVLIIGNGGREHALVWKISQSPNVGQIFCAPGNAGTEKLAKNVVVDPVDVANLLKFALSQKIDLTIVGPELPLSLGIVNRFEEKELSIFGPSREAARVETSKVWLRKFLKKIGVPSPDFLVFDRADQALAYVSVATPCVVKAEGLAAGKGVFVCNNPDKAKEAVTKIMVDKVFGKAGERVVVEEFLEGEEVSVIAFCDGKNFLFLPCARDYKRALDNDQGLNTGGMGAYAPSPFLSKEKLNEIGFTILQPVLDGLLKLGTPYKGILYAGLMITSQGIKVLEFNCRFGDPETQVQLPLLKNDLFEVMLACIEEDLDFSLEFENKACLSVVLASSGYPQEYETGKEITGLNGELPQDTLIFHAGTKKFLDKYLTNGGRVLNITAISDNLDKARKKIYSLIGNPISFSNMAYRKDIGIAIPLLH